MIASTKATATDALIDYWSKAIVPWIDKSSNKAKMRKLRKTYKETLNCFVCSNEESEDFFHLIVQVAVRNLLIIVVKNVKKGIG
jgi:hypothetical protein